MLSLVSLLFTFGVVEAGSPWAVVGDIGTPQSFLLVSILGILLWLAGASRWAAGLLIALCPVGIAFGMLQLVPALTPFRSHLAPCLNEWPLVPGSVTQ